MIEDIQDNVFIPLACCRFGYAIPTKEKEDAVGVFTNLTDLPMVIAEASKVMLHRRRKQSPLSQDRGVSHILDPILQQLETMNLLSHAIVCHTGGHHAR